jgi:hypothetical protein
MKFFFSQFSIEEDLVEELTQIIKHFMRGMGKNFEYFLPEYKNLIIDGYKTKPISTYIYAFEVIATVFASDSNNKQLLKDLLKEICVQTFGKYLTKPEDYEENPLLGEEIFGMLYRLVKLNVFLILDFELLDSLLKIAIENLNVSHLETCKNLIYFLMNIINFHELSKSKDIDHHGLVIYYENVKKNILILGESLVRKIIEYLIEVPPEILFDHIKDLVFIIAMNYTESAEWFANVLKNIPKDILTLTEKEKIVRNILDYNETNLDDLFSLFYRRSLSRHYRKKN